MAFTVRDYSDLVRLLAEHPEWQAELRRLILSEDFLALPAIVRDLAEAQRRSEARLAGVEERLSRLEAVVTELAEAQRRSAEHLGDLSLAQRQFTDKLSAIDGRTLEQTYREKAGAYFGRMLRGLKVVPSHTLENTLEENLSPEEFEDVLLVDLLVSGRPRQAPDAPEVWLAVEVSVVIDRGDVERAQRRAALLRKAGYRAIPVVAGEGLTQGATQLLQEAPVLLVLDGRSQGWEEALAVA